MRTSLNNLLGGIGLLVLVGPPAPALAGDASLLKTTLTPMGAERAGNAAGTIPAWTGGFTTLPAGWVPDKAMAPDFFKSDSSVITVNAANMAQYADQLSDGVKSLITRKGFYLKVYPTHRTAAAPQWVYDNIAANVPRAKLLPAGGRLGFTGGYGGVPFAIPDINDPLAAGAQIIWNHQTRWLGVGETSTLASYVSQGGQIVFAGAGITQNYYPYYDPQGSLATYQGYQLLDHTSEFAPASQAGIQIIAHYATNTLTNPNILWELLQGEGRVRKAPQLTYDTPASSSNGVVNYDEYYGFNGAMDEYDWRYVGKKEMFIPYNNNGLRLTPAALAHLPKFLNPDYVRWELHRVWVVDATLHPGKRNVLAHRRFFVDEDTWQIGLADDWDASGNIYREDMTFNCVRPDLPGTVFLNSVAYNLQTGDYTDYTGPWGNAPFNKPEVFGHISESAFEPQAMAAAASY